MPSRSLNPVTLRPVDLAREHGLSTQAVREYEAQGVLPPAARTAAGYRVYTTTHAAALRAYLALTRAHGYAVARQVMRAVVADDLGAALAALDDSHAQLARDRAALASVRAAAAYLGGPAEPVGGDFTVGDLAARLRLSRATLRSWERVGVLAPRRDRAGQRVYDAAQVRDADFALMLRRGGWGLARIAEVLGEVRALGRPAGAVAGGGWDAGAGRAADGTAERPALAATLDAWEERLVAQGRAMLRAAALLDELLQG